MPVESVHLVQGHDIDVFLEEIHIEEVQTAVQMHTTIWESRSILDVTAGQLPFDTPLPLGSEDLGGKELENSLNRIECSGTIAIVHHHPAGADAKMIRLRLEAGIQNEYSFFTTELERISRHHRKRESGSFHEPFIQESGSADKGRIPAFNIDGCLAVKFENALRCLDAGGLRDNADHLRSLLRAGAGSQQDQNR